jgi:hypothetical protein
MMENKVVAVHGVANKLLTEANRIAPRASVRKIAKQTEPQYIREGILNFLRAYFKTGFL